MELVWNSRLLTPQERVNTTSSRTQRRKQGLHLSLNNCDDVLCFLEDFSVLVCKEHHTAVVNLDTHLLQHHNVPAATRKQIVEHFSSFATVSPAEIELPDEPAQPIDELREPLDGLQCKTCSFITVNKDTMRMHCKKNHQQAWLGEKSLLYKAVKVQSFFRSGGLQKYFIVDLVDAQIVENAGVENIVSGLLAEYELIQQEVEEELQTLEEAAKTDKTGWFKRTGWLEFLKDRKSRSPSVSSPQIQYFSCCRKSVVAEARTGLESDNESNTATN